MSFRICLLGFANIQRFLLTSTLGVRSPVITIRFLTWLLEGGGGGGWDLREKYRARVLIFQPLSFKSPAQELFICRAYFFLPSPLPLFLCLELLFGVELSSLVSEVFQSFFSFLLVQQGETTTFAYPLGRGSWFVVHH